MHGYITQISYRNKKGIPWLVQVLYQHSVSLALYEEIYSNGTAYQKDHINMGYNDNAAGAMDYQLLRDKQEH